jgi:hypothetical protein
MSYEELPALPDIPWLEEPTCGLPEQKKDDSLVEKVPVIGSYFKSSGQGVVGKGLEMILSKGGSMALSKALGAGFAVTKLGGLLVDALGPIIGDGAAKLAEKGAEKAFKKGVDEGAKRGAKAANKEFSPSGAVKTMARGLAMTAEEAITGTSAGRARFRMQAAMGEHGVVGTGGLGGGS